MIIWGDRDQVIPVSHAHIAHELIPGSRLEIVEGAGHFLPIERPELHRSPPPRLPRHHQARQRESQALARGPPPARLAAVRPPLLAETLRLCGENVAMRRKPLTDVGGYGPASMAVMLVSYRGGSRIWRRPIRERVLITCGDDSIAPRTAFEAAANRLARDLQGRGVGLGDMVTIALPELGRLVRGGRRRWKLGAVPQPVSSRLPDPELRRSSSWPTRGRVRRRPDGSGRSCLPVGPRPHRPIGHPSPTSSSPAWKAPTSGGSTGRPKLIVSGDPATLDDEAAAVGVTPTAAS